MSSSARPRYAETWGATLRAALDSIEWPDCTCAHSLMSICLIGKEQGCWRRRNRSQCECKVRWLPSCLRKKKHGCNKRRLSQHSGKVVPECLLEQPRGCFARQQIGICECERVPKPACDCSLAPMPCCMASGCPKRQLGHLCDCPHGPSERCRHMGYADEMRMKAAFLTIQNMFPQYDAYSMWAYLQRERHPKQYADPEPPGVPEDMTDRECAVAVMEFRAKLGVGLFHPQDLRSPTSESEHRRQKSQVLNLGLFLRLAKGDGHDNAA